MRSILITLMLFSSFCEKKVHSHAETLFGISKSGVNIRAAPTTDSLKVGLIAFGEPVQLLERGEKDKIGDITAEWVRIKRKDTTGWAFSGYLARHPPSSLPMPYPTLPDDWKLFQQANPYPPDHFKAYEDPSGNKYIVYEKRVKNADGVYRPMIKQRIPFDLLENEKLTFGEECRTHAGEKLAAAIYLAVFKRTGKYVGYHFEEKLEKLQVRKAFIYDLKKDTLIEYPRTKGIPCTFPDPVEDLSGLSE